MMVQTPSIIIIIPYFGQWPFWMPFFIESCRANPDINWLLLGDCAALEDLPNNVEQRVFDFVDYCAFVSECLGLSFNPSNPYKLCDLKPALGFIHAADVAGYDFWGFSDLDLIYGDLRSYFSDERLRKYKVLSTHERRISGHFCLLRNEPELNSVFWKIPDFVRRAEDPKNHALDEGGFSRIFLWRKNFPKPLFELVGLFNRWRRVAEFKEAFSTPNGIRPWTDGTQDYPAYWAWRNGRLQNAKDGDRQFPYLHFLVWKKYWQQSSHEPMSYEQAQVLASRRNWRIDRDGFHIGDDQ
ncbi:hypothetical protein DQ403_20100 [Stutzerimonas zhaodongensis]|uniref:Glycosyl transferase n=1 Tax=Stutzerimonas zhaodongensis TaxID=1176257 RepID=A0A365PPR2_9GAMM|nr:DUF6625 family protein [Stutzerimonas zhaodongensis]RBA52970.1 hypothetical protein DQ403_20100 [Stutzerimonas zhaodongensis]